MMRCCLGGDIAVFETLLGHDAQIAWRILQTGAHLLDQLLLELAEELLTPLEDQFLLGSAEGVFLFIQADEIGVGRRFEQLAQAGHEVGFADLVGGRDSLGGVLEFELQIERQEAEQGAIHTADALDLIVQVLPVGLGPILLVELADEVELVLHPQRPGRGTEP